MNAPACAACGQPVTAPFAACPACGHAPAVAPVERAMPVPESPIPGAPPPVADPARPLPPPRPEPLEYRRAGPGWRLVALAMTALLALQFMLIRRSTLGARYDFGEFLQTVAGRFLLIAAACFLVVGGLGRLLLGRRTSARGPLVAMALVYAGLAADRWIIDPEVPPAPPVEAVADAVVPAAPAPAAPPPAPEPSPAPPQPEPEWSPSIAVEPDAPATSNPPVATTPGAPIAPRNEVRPLIDDWAITADRLHRNYDWVALGEHGRRWAEAQPREARAWQAMGIALARQGRYDEAIAAFERQLALAPGDVYGLPQIAYAYQDKGDWRGATDAYERVLHYHPRDRYAWIGMGHALSLLGDYDEAVEALEHATALDPHDRDAWQQLALAHQRAGYPGRAQDAFERMNRRR